MNDLTLKDIFKILLNRIWLVAIIPLVAVLATTVMVYFVIEPSYTTSTTLYVLYKQGENLGSSDLTTSQMIVNDCRELATSNRVLSEVANQFGLNADTIKSNFNINVTAATSTRVVELSVTHTDPVLAANVANAIAQQLAQSVVDFMDVNSVNIVDSATPPALPSAPNKTRTIMLAGVVGLLLGVGLALLIDMLNTTIRTSDDVENMLGLTVLGQVPRIEVK